MKVLGLDLKIQGRKTFVYFDYGGQNTGGGWKNLVH